MRLGRYTQRYKTSRFHYGETFDGVKVSAKAVDIHPVYGFVRPPRVALFLEVALFGVAGVLLAVPGGAMILALVGIYVRRHEVIDDAEMAEEENGARP